MTKKKIMYILGLVISTVIIVIASISVASLMSQKTTKGNSDNKLLTAENNGSIITLKVGEKINLELKDFGDGGYTWEIVTLDEETLSLTEKLDSEPSGLMGDFGNDIWVFTAEKTGTTTLELKSSRSWDKTDVCATFSVEIEVL